MNMHHHRGMGSDDMNHISNGIWIGGHNVLKSAHWLTSKGIRNVINAAIEFITETPELVNWEDLSRNGIEVHNTYWDDTMAQPIFPSASLETALKKIDDVLRQGRPILVNCAMGKSRSTSLVIAYFIARQGMSYDQALATCKRGRPLCQPNPNFERQLRHLESTLRGSGSIPNSPLTPASGFTGAAPQSLLNGPPAPPTSALRSLSPSSHPQTPTTPPMNNFNSLPPNPPASSYYTNPYSSQAGVTSPVGNPTPSYTNPLPQPTSPTFNQNAASSLYSSAPPQSPARSTPASPPMSPSFSSPNRNPYNSSATMTNQNLGLNRLPSQRGTASASGNLNHLIKSYGVNGSSRAAPSPSAGTGFNKIGGIGTGVGSSPLTNTQNRLSRLGGPTTNRPTGAPANRYRMNDYMSPLRRRLSL